MLEMIISTFYLCLPAYVANMLPAVCSRWHCFRFLGKPVHERAFGDHKTWRGLVVGTIGGIIVAGLQSLITTGYEIIDYNQTWWLFGFLAGLGAVLGDLTKSYFKRRIGFKPGEPWLFFDQVDYLVGFFCFTSFIVYPTWQLVAIGLILSLILHPLVNLVAYYLKIKAVWW